MSVSKHAQRLQLFGQWLRNPRQTAAVVPSSGELVAAVLAALPSSAQRVIELGGGTGAISEALLQRCRHAEDLLILELNPSLHARLRERFAMARVINGDAQYTYELARGDGFLEAGPVDAVVSGLGLLAMGRDAQSAILQSAFACLKPEGVLIQFTYGPLAPVGNEVQEALGLSAQRGAFVLRNVPPATVWVFRRSRAKAIKPRRAG